MEPLNLYGIDGVVKQNIYQDANISVPVYSTDFNYGAVEQISIRLASNQGVVQADDAVSDTIVLRLPAPNAAGSYEVLSLIGRFNYIGPADPNDPASTLLGLYGDIEGVSAAPGDLAADLRFYIYIDPTEVVPVVAGRRSDRRHIFLVRDHRWCRRHRGLPSRTGPVPVGIGRRSPRAGEPEEEREKHDQGRAVDVQAATPAAEEAAAAAETQCYQGGAPGKAAEAAAEGRAEQQAETAAPGAGTPQA